MLEVAAWQDSTAGSPQGREYWGFTTPACSRAAGCLCLSASVGVIRGSLFSERITATRFLEETGLLQRPFRVAK
jgi:hypothetical protein